MEYTEEQNNKIQTVMRKLSRGDQNVMKSPATKVMAINLLSAFNWNLQKTLDSL